MNRWEVVRYWIKNRGYKRGVEVGVKEGRFISYILNTDSKLHMIAVDPWESQPEGNENYNEWDFDLIYKQYKNRIKPFKSRVLQMRMYSQKAANLITNESVDFVFIDAQHDYESVKRDINSWLPKIRLGGLICGHDYEPNFPGVIQAVDEKFKRKFTGKNATWGSWI